MVLINWYKKYTRFQKGFFWIFMIATFFSFFLPAMTGASWTVVFGLDAVIGLLSSVTGVLNSIYVARAEVVLYLFWGANTLFYGIQCFLEQLYASFFLNIVVVLPIIIIGFFVWLKEIKRSKAAGEMEEGETIRIKKFNKKQWIISIVLYAIGWIAYGFFAYYFPEIVKYLFNINVQPDPDFIIDSFIAIGTIYAVVLTTTRNVENWLFWLAINLAGTVLFIFTTVQSAMQGQISVIAISGAIMYVQYLTSSIYGYYLWLKINKRQNAKELEKTKVAQ
ncbi:MAG: nicotinamide riboside transporter PnuC [Sarcina sp.]